MQDVFQRNVRFDGGGGFGNCVLARPVAQHCRCHPLPGSGEPRGLLEVTATIEGKPLTVFCTHLGLDSQTRFEQAKEIVEIVRSAPNPKVLCGDMNDRPNSRTLATLLEDPVLRDVALEFDAPDTFPQGPERRIDFILADLRLNAKVFRVVETNASDHFPLVVDLELA